MKIIKIGQKLCPGEAFQYFKPDFLIRLIRNSGFFWLMTIYIKRSVHRDLVCIPRWPVAIKTGRKQNSPFGTFNVADSLKVLLYIEQLKGLLSMWILSWIFKVPALANFLSQFEQQNGFSPVWNLSCTFNVADSLKVLSHIEQLKRFLLSLWILSWIFKVPARVNLITLWTAKWFLLCMNF